jgi:hypothetical protein
MTTEAEPTRRLNQPITLRITEAEVVESQLSEDDLHARTPITYTT